MNAPLFRVVADHALLVEFGETISDAAHAEVLKLDHALKNAPFTGFREAIPAYVNILVDFDPLLTDHDTAETHLRALMLIPDTAQHQSRVHNVAVCYEAPFAQDLAAVAAKTGLTEEAVVNAHLAGSYKVYLYGFAPGYAYLAGTPPALQLPRKPSPVRGVEAGSVIIAGPQCLITTLTMPTGWWVIGRSPIQILTGRPDHPFLFDVGDQIRFQRISLADFETAKGAPI
jgi:inhibitor of KinA